MSLNSLHFIVLLFLLLLAMSVAQFVWNRFSGKTAAGRVQRLLLLAFSLYFISAWDWRHCVCSVTYTCVVYVLGILEDKTKYGRIFAVIGVICSIVMLGYFKYTNFFITSFARLFGVTPKTLKIILPLGISFYTFSGIAYLLDVHQGKLAAERNIVDFSLYMLFFGKITAGPIVRANTFFPQIKNYCGVRWDGLLVGLQIFVFGLFKKIVLADHLGVFVDDVYYAPSAYNTATVILGIVSYSLQIYFDFSGYSDMAIGVSKMVGFDFEPNFNLPYLANSVSDFWKRWHISLSSWLQDYLYIPLGGSRKGNVRTYLNLLLVMLISGVWHGVGFTFIVWGLLHGFASCANRLIKKSAIKINWPQWCGVIATYIQVALLWVPFRADNMKTAIDVWKGAFSLHSGICQPYTWSFFAISCLMISTVVAITRAKKEGQQYINGFYPVLDLSRFWNLVLFFTFAGLTVLMGYFGNTAFIYGKF